MKARSLHRLIHRLRAVAGIALVVALQSQRQVNAEPAMVQANHGILPTAEISATAWRFFGPYGERYEALPHVGHNTFFRDDQGQWWSTYFGSDGQAPWQERSGVLPVESDTAGRVRPKIP